MTIEANDSLPTRPSLLSRLRSGDDTESWQEFYRAYGPLIRNFALKAGLSEDEADEVVQETAVSVARHLPGFVYDPQVCSFKTWLLHLTKWRLYDQVRKRRPAGTPPAASGMAGASSGVPTAGDDTARTATLDRIPDPVVPDFGAEWDAAYERQVLDRALVLLREEVDIKPYQIYDLYVLKQWPAAEVARTMGLSVAGVYLTKHRVGRLLRQIVSRLERPKL